MLDCDINEIFDALETISLMSDEEFENTRLEFGQDGLDLERDEDGNISVTVKK